MLVVFTEMPEKCVQASNTGNYLLPRTPDLHTVSQGIAEDLENIEEKGSPGARSGIRGQCGKFNIAIMIVAAHWAAPRVLDIKIIKMTLLLITTIAQCHSAAAGN